MRAPVGAQRHLVFRNPAGHAHRETPGAVDDQLLTLRRTDTRSVLRNGLPRGMLSARILPGGIGYLRIRAEFDLPPGAPGTTRPR